MRREDRYRVDTGEGRLVYQDAPHQTVFDEPYILTYVNGAEEPSLEKWKQAAVSAALAEKFLEVSPDGFADDLGRLFEAYNDAMMGRKIGKLNEQIANVQDPDAKAKLQSQRDALFKNIQSDEFRELLKA